MELSTYCHLVNCSSNITRTPNFMINVCPNSRKAKEKAQVELTLMMAPFHLGVPVTGPIRPDQKEFSIWLRGVVETFGNLFSKKILAEQKDLRIVVRLDGQNA